MSRPYLLRYIKCRTWQKKSYMSNGTEATSLAAHSNYHNHCEYWNMELLIKMAFILFFFKVKKSELHLRFFLFFWYCNRTHCNYHNHCGIQLILNETGNIYRERISISMHVWTVQIQNKRNEYSFQKLMNLHEVWKITFPKALMSFSSESIFNIKYTVFVWRLLLNIFNETRVENISNKGTVKL